MHKLSLFFLLCGLLLFQPAPELVRAQQALQPNTPVSGDLSAGASDTWSFSVRDGAMLSFYVEATDETLDPMLSIRSSTGELLLSHDDIAYPDNSNALIEAFSAPRSGNYEVLVSAHGQSSGAYELKMTNGFAELVLADNFTSISNWSLSPDSNEEAILSAQNGRLALELAGIQQTATAINPSASTGPDFYAHVDVRGATGRNGWQAGLSFRRQTDGSHYLVSIDNRGLWRVSLLQNGQTNILRDWNSHPAIIPDNPDFSIAVLANRSDFDFFYDGQLIGTISNSAVSAGGSVGVYLASANAIGSSASASFDNLIATEPIQLDDRELIPQQVLTGSANVMVRDLQRRRVLPPGGEIVLTIPESFAQNVSPGVSRFPLARGSSYRNFALAANVSWRDTGGLSGCGLIARDQNATPDNYALAYVDSQGGYGLAQRENDAFSTSIFGDQIPLRSGETYHLLLIGVEDTLTYFLQGRYVGQITLSNPEGGIGEAVVNFEPVDTACRFDNLWLWRSN